MEETKTGIPQRAPDSGTPPPELVQEGLADVGKWLGKMLSTPSKHFKAEVVDTVQLGAAAGMDALAAAQPIYFAVGEGRKVKLHAELTLWATLE